MQLYDLLAGQERLGKHRWLNASEAAQRAPGLVRAGLKGGYTFFDGQMDDHALGCWAAEKAQLAGVDIRLHHAINTISLQGTLTIEGGTQHRFDHIVNVAGPWAEQLVRNSGIACRHHLDLVRGSHLLLDRPLTHGVLLEVPGSHRVVFVLPYRGKTLLGTTEVKQTILDPIVCSTGEKSELIDLYNRFFTPLLNEKEVVQVFSGARPLVRSSSDPTRNSREYVIERQDRLTCVLGGKWTTSRALGEKVASVVMQ
jgi:glycerol-3-phosphate dehydrogenase